MTTPAAPTEGSPAEQEIPTTQDASQTPVPTSADVTTAAPEQSDKSVVTAEDMVIDEPVQGEIKSNHEESSPVTETLIEARKEQNVFSDAQISFPYNGHDPVFVSLPGDTSKRTEEIINNLPNIPIDGTKQGDKWADTVRNSIRINSYEDVFLENLEDPKSDFSQSLVHNGTRFGSHEAKFKERQNSDFNGDMAVLRTISHLGLGSTWNVGLWNTGIWVTFKPPTEEDLVELYRQLTSDQIMMGRLSYGLVYANTSSFIIERLCKFAVNHIYRVNAKAEEIGPANVLNYIKAQDISSLLWGLACTMFPKGFGYNRACIADPTKCQHVVTETLNLRKLQLVNRAALSERQKSHMAENRGQTKLTIQDMKLYESDMVKASNRCVVVNKGEEDEIKFNLRSPSVMEYIETGHRWIDDMVNSVEQALGSESSFDDRNNAIDMRSRATIMRQYCHWVDSIEFDSNTITDRASIEKTINSISGDQVIRETFLTEIKEFIENSSVAIIGIPTYDCPKCGKTNEGPVTYPHRTTMIPIDVVQLFFVLLTQKHRDLANR